jgi:hypothetical protein
MKEKQLKIWGPLSGIIGDLIMGIPILTYYNKKYPESYKFWTIQKKCAQCAPLYFNHPLIDRIKISDEWDQFGDYDKKLIDECDIKTRPSTSGWKHSTQDWYNYFSCVEETAFMAGVLDLKDVLSEDEMRPSLYKWFDAGAPAVTSTYAKSKNQINENYNNNIAIWPFAGSPGRSPSPKWWNRLIDNLILNGYTISHYGMPWDPILSNLEGYKTYPYLSYFDQVKSALASRLVIGTDSGAQWVMGAYSHPAINLMTNWLPNHNNNLLALEPVNKNSETFYAQGGCDNISAKLVLNSILERVSL